MMFAQSPMYNGMPSAGIPTPMPTPMVVMPQPPTLPDMNNNGHVVVGNEQRPGDWQCPNTNCVNHTKLVFGTKSSCPKCGFSRGQPYGGEAQEKPAPGMRGGDMPGDWQCPNSACINSTKLVFAKYQSCPLCSTARNAKQPGDWLCPNPQCVNSTNTVFASKPMCPKCGCPRGGYSWDKGAGKGGVKAIGWTTAIHQIGNPEDWRCPNTGCMNHVKMVFAKHDACPKCNMAKPENPQSLGMMSWKGGAGHPGDWQCPKVDCLNHKNWVFAKHGDCPRCGTPKPGGVVG